MNQVRVGELVECLAVSGPSNERLQKLKRISKRDWEALLPWMDLSGIALPLWDSVQRAGAEGILPPQIRAVFEMKLENHRQRVTDMALEFDSLNRQFQHAGIDCVVWKGFALIPDYCPDPCLRLSYDYDYLVSRNDWDKSRTMLEGSGYILKPDPDTQVHLTFVLRHGVPRQSISAVGLYAPALPRKVELHLSPWDEAASHIPLSVPAGTLDRKVRRMWRGMSFDSLGELDTFVFQMIHAFQHILHNWCRLGWLREIAYFLERRSTDRQFWNSLDDYLGSDGLLKEVVALVVSLAARLFHATLSPPVERQMRGAMRRPVALWVEHYGLSSALNNFSENKYSLFLYREFVREEAYWQEIRRCRLLPLHRPNRIADAAPAAPFVLLPESWKQGWYVVQRLIHHTVSGAGYAWESARWQRMRRLCVDRVLR